jgi:hypothetical protein
MSFLNPATTETRRRRLLVGGLSVLLTTTVMVGFLLESRWGYSPRDVTVIYMQNWSADRSRTDAQADSAATIAAQQARLAQSRAYIATLKGKAHEKAQAEYDRYVEGGGVKKDIPYVTVAEEKAAQRQFAPGTAVAPGTAARAATAAEPPVL